MSLCICAHSSSLSLMRVYNRKGVNCGNCTQNCVKPDDKQKTSDKAEFSIFKTEINIVT
jgi:hypothetical protein